ncbi:MAG: NifU family protein [Flavobacteriales bacterium]|nr:NifU family protein [Flavobacteriales bacterium]
MWTASNSNRSPRALEALTDLRPFLEADGGDISLEEVTPDGIARVRLHGACTNCAMSPMTMKAGGTRSVTRCPAPRIVRVEAVNMRPHRRSWPLGH